MAKVEPMTHEQLVAWCIEYLNRIPESYAYPTHGGWRAKPKVPGEADIANVRKGRAYYYEIKIGDDTVSPDQIRFRDRVREAGGSWDVIRSPEDLVVYFPREEPSHARR